MKLKLISTLAVLTLLASLFGAAMPAAAANSTLTLTNNIQNHNQGDTFTVPVLINTDWTVRAYQMDVTFEIGRAHV